MQGITAMKVPDKYEQKSSGEIRVFDDAVSRILAVPASKVQKKIASNTSERDVSRDSSGEV